MCVTKKKFDKKSAKSALNEAEKNPKKWRHEKRYYYCKDCNSWHLTSDEEYEKIIEIPLEELKFKEKWMELQKEMP